MMGLLNCEKKSFRTADRLFDLRRFGSSFSRLRSASSAERPAADEPSSANRADAGRLQNSGACSCSCPDRQPPQVLSERG